MTVYNWIIAISLMLGLALFFTYISDKDIITFFGFLTIFNGFCIWVDFLPFWTITLNMIVLTTLIFIKLKGGLN